MKKSLLALAALAGISMLFMGCPKTTGNNETPADNTPAEETPTEETPTVEKTFVFKPGETAVSFGEVTEIGGVKYLKVTPDGWNTNGGIQNGADLTGKTKVYANFYSEAADSGYKFAVKIVGDWSDNDKNIEVVTTELTAGVNKIEADAKAITVIALQPFVQSTSDWNAVSDKTLYIGEIWAE